MNWISVQMFWRIFIDFDFRSCITKWHKNSRWQPTCPRRIKFPCFQKRYQTSSSHLYELVQNPIDQNIQQICIWIRNSFIFRKTASTDLKIDFRLLWDMLEIQERWCFRTRRPLWIFSALIIWNISNFQDTKRSSEKKKCKYKFRFMKEKKNILEFFFNWKTMKKWWEILGRVEVIAFVGILKSTWELSIKRREDKGRRNQESQNRKFNMQSAF